MHVKVVCRVANKSVTSWRLPQWILAYRGDDGDISCQPSSRPTIFVIIAEEVTTYCESEVVQLRCQKKNEVIVVTHAKYGRMREGRCMTSAYGVVGCSADVIHLLDSLCSGRRQCDVNVASLVDEEHQPCPLDFRSYLELAHKCVTGVFL